MYQADLVKYFREFGRVNFFAELSGALQEVDYSIFIPHFEQIEVIIDNERLKRDDTVFACARV